MYLKGKQNHIKLEIKTTFQHKSSNQPSFTKTLINNSTKFHQNFQQQSNSHYQSINMNTKCINSSRTHPITTTTTFNHEIIHKLTTTTSFFINFAQNPNILIYIHLSMQFQHQQHNYHSIYIHEHIIKIKARISTTKLNNHLFK